MIDNDNSDDDNILHGAFNSLKAISGTPIDEPTDTDSSHHTPPISIKKLKQGEVEMADIITGTTTGFVNNTQDAILAGVSDLRREGAEHTNEGVKETLKSGWAGVDATKDARYDVASRISDSREDLSNQATQFYIAGQKNATDAATDIAALKVLTDANASRISTELALGIEKAAAAAALSAEKIATAVALGQSTLSKEVLLDGQKTRDLINDLKYHDMNRYLIERNTELVEEREGRRHWRYQADLNQSQGQWAALQSQIQAFQSQLQDTRQGMVNLGTMTGVGQTATPTNIR